MELEFLMGVGAHVRALARACTFVVAAALSGLCAVLACAAESSPLRIHITESITPFALPETNSGLSVEIMRAAFDSQGVATAFVFLPSARAWSSF